MVMTGRKPKAAYAIDQVAGSDMTATGSPGAETHGSVEPAREGGVPPLAQGVADNRHRQGAAAAQTEAAVAAEKKETAESTALHAADAAADRRQAPDVERDQRLEALDSVVGSGPRASVQEADITAGRADQLGDVASEERPAQVAARGDLDGHVGADERPRAAVASARHDGSGSSADILSDKPGGDNAEAAAVANVGAPAADVPLQAPNAGEATEAHTLAAAMDSSPPEAGGLTASVADDRSVHGSPPIHVHVDGASLSDSSVEAPRKWIERILIDRLEFDAQVRELCQFRVVEYDQEMGNGSKFPPLEVHSCVDAAGVRHYYLVGGFHRLSAYIGRRHKYVECEVTEGDLRAAKWAAAASNIAHGIRRNDHDKRRAVLLLLEDDEWRGMSNRQIAAHVKVSPTFVGNMRLEYDRKHGVGPDQVTTRKSSDNRTFTFGGSTATPPTENGETAPPPKRPTRKARVPLKFGRTKPGPGLAPAIPAADHKPEEVPTTPKEMPQATDQQQESPAEAEAAHAADSGDALTLCLQDLCREGVPFTAILATIKRIWDVL